MKMILLCCYCYCFYWHHPHPVRHYEQSMVTMREMQSMATTREMHRVFFGKPYRTPPDKYRE